jgi:hypothetical protein
VRHREIEHHCVLIVLPFVTGRVHRFLSSSLRARAGRVTLIKDVIPSFGETSPTQVFRRPTCSSLRRELTCPPAVDAEMLKKSQRVCSVAVFRVTPTSQSQCDKPRLFARIGNRRGSGDAPMYSHIAPANRRRAACGDSFQIASLVNCVPMRLLHGRTNIDQFQFFRDRITAFDRRCLGTLRRRCGMKRLAWIFPWLFTLVRPKYTVKTQGRRQLKAQATDCRHNRHTTAGLVRETGLDSAE